MNQDMSSAPAPAPMPEEPKKGTNVWLIVAIVVVVLCCCCVGAAAIWYAVTTYGNEFSSSVPQLLSLL